MQPTRRRFIEDPARKLLDIGVLGYLLPLIISRNGLIVLTWIMLVTSAHLSTSCQHKVTSNILSACFCAGDEIMDGKGIKAIAIVISAKLHKIACDMVSFFICLSFGLIWN
jgi:hypothetical protein